MRQIYTSPRLENVERVIALMKEHGIETSLVNRRAWQGGAWKRFSYTERGNRDAWPQVWVTHSNDQTQARQLLRDAGLEMSSRFADELADARGASDVGRHRAASNRARMLLLGLIGAVAVLIGMAYFLR